MNKKFLAIAMAAGLATAVPAHAQFGGLASALGGGSTSKSSVSAGDVDAFLKTAGDAQGLMKTSADKLFEAVASKDQIQKVQDEQRAAESITDPKEKEAKLKQVEAEKQTILSQANYTAKAEEMKKGLDEKKKAQIGASIWNFTLAMLKNKQLAEQGSGLVSSIGSNPMLVTKLGAVKDVVSSIGGQMGNVTKIASGLQKLATVVKVDTQQIKASSSAKETSD